MYLIYVLILTLVSIASSEPPVFGTPFNRELQTFGRFQTSPSSNFQTANGFRHPNLIYGPPSNSHNHNNNNNNYPPYYPPFFPTHRPPVNSYGVPPNSNNHYNPNGHPGYNYKPSSFFRSGVPNGEAARFEKPLFSPSNGVELAATNGQIDNFNKALQEETQQLLQGQGQGQADEVPSTMFANGFTGFANLEGPSNQPKSYVSVKFGQPNHQYQYEF